MYIEYGEGTMYIEYGEGTMYIEYGEGTMYIEWEDMYIEWEDMYIECGDGGTMCIDCGEGRCSWPLNYRLLREDAAAGPAFRAPKVWLSGDPCMCAG